MKRKTEPFDVLYYAAITFGLCVIALGLVTYVARLVVAICQ
jgi:hypothetical protein